MSCDTRSVPDL